MSYWSDYFDDFSQDVLLYKEKLPITHAQFMRWAAEGLMRAQRSIRAVLGAKVVTTQNGTDFNLGDDVMFPLKVVDVTNGIQPIGAEIIPQSIVQKQDTMERSLVGKNEVPHIISQFRYGVAPQGILAQVLSGLENFVYDRHNYTLRVYPTLGPNSQIAIEYVVEFRPFSPNWTQWNNWFPVGSNNFITQFTATPIPQEWCIYDTAFKAYATMKYLLANRSPDYRVYAQLYDTEIENIRQSLPNDYFAGASPYTISPDSF